MVADMAIPRLEVKGSVVTPQPPPRRANAADGGTALRTRGRVWGNENQRPPAPLSIRGRRREDGAPPSY